MFYPGSENLPQIRQFTPFSCDNNKALIFRNYNVSELTNLDKKIADLEEEISLKEQMTVLVGTACQPGYTEIDAGNELRKRQKPYWLYPALATVNFSLSAI